MIKLIDAYTPTTMPAGWTAMALIHKATQGVTNQQAAYPTRRTQHNTAGKAAFGAYHAFMGNADAAAQARWFVAYAKPVAGDILALDLENFDGSWSGKSRAQLASMAKTFLATVRFLCPRNKLVLYCNRSDYNTIVKAYGVPLYDGLWLATLDNTRPTAYPWIICQYAVIAGVDWNDAKFNTQAELKSWAAGRPPVVEPKEDDQMDACIIDGQLAVFTVGTDGFVYVTTDHEGDLWALVTDDRKYAPGITCIPDFDGTGAFAAVRTPDKAVHLLKVPNATKPITQLDKVGPAAGFVDQAIGGSGNGTPSITALPDQTLVFFVKGTFTTGEFANRIYTKQIRRDGTVVEWNPTEGAAL
jgi:hypothetical protein